jgi:hypothetical protein
VRNVLSQVLIKVDSSNILREVEFENGFHFCNNGVYTNVTAISLKDFAEKLEDVEDDSIEFHYPRGDFQFWITKILGDDELGNRMCFIDRGLNGQKLKQELSKLVKDRINELASSIKIQLSVKTKIPY